MRYSTWMLHPDSSPSAPAKYIGMLDGFGLLAPLELYKLAAPVGDHPAGSSVSRETLETHGYTVPPVNARRHWSFVLRVLDRAGLFIGGQRPATAKAGRLQAQ